MNISEFENFLLDTPKRIVLLANGPSLNEYQRQEDDILFGTNRIYLKYPDVDFYTVVNPILIAQFNKEIEKRVKTDYRFIPEGYEDYITGITFPITPIPTFSLNPAYGIYEGGTVTYVALQLLYFMGAQKVYIYGLDHSYIFNGEPNEQILMRDDDPNHFDKNYFKDMYWNAPDLELSEKAYRLANETYNKAGRKIINATRGSKCTIFAKD